MYLQRGFRLCWGSVYADREGDWGALRCGGTFPEPAHAVGKHSQREREARPLDWHRVSAVTLGKGVSSPSLSSASITQGGGHAHFLGGCGMDAVMSGRRRVPPQKPGLPQRQQAGVVGDSTGPHSCPSPTSSEQAGGPRGQEAGRWRMVQAPALAREEIHRASQGQQDGDRRLGWHLGQEGDVVAEVRPAQPSPLPC